MPLGPPLPDDAVAAKRGESGMLGGLSVPLSWGTAVPPDDYNHWAKESEDGVEAAAVIVPGEVTPEPENAEELDEWTMWNEWVAENEEPRFDIPRTSGNFVPNSPAAG